MKTKRTPPLPSVTGPLLLLDTIGATRRYHRRTSMAEKLTRVEAKGSGAAPPSTSASTPADLRPIMTAGQTSSVTLTGHGRALYRGIVGSKNVASLQPNIKR